jgi:hypothetical protein
MASQMAIKEAQMAAQIAQLKSMEALWLANGLYPKLSAPAGLQPQPQPRPQPWPQPLKNRACSALLSTFPISSAPYLQW